MKTTERHRKDSRALPLTSLRPFQDLLRDLNRSNVTGWRWRKTGIIRTVTIRGKVYVSVAAIREFEKRAAKGEFAGPVQSQIVREKTEASREIDNEA